MAVIVPTSEPLLQKPPLQFASVAQPKPSWSFRLFPAQWPHRHTPDAQASFSAVALVTAAAAVAAVPAVAAVAATPPAARSVRAQGSPSFANLMHLPEHKTVAPRAFCDLQ